MEKLEKLNKKELILIATKLKNRINSNLNLINSIKLLKKIELENYNLDFEKIIYIFNVQNKNIKKLKVNYKNCYSNKNCNDLIKIIKKLACKLLQVHDYLMLFKNEEIHHFMFKIAHANYTAYNEYFYNLNIDYLLKY